MEACVGSTSSSGSSRRGPARRAGSRSPVPGWRGGDAGARRRCDRGQRGGRGRRGGGRWPRGDAVATDGSSGDTAPCAALCPDAGGACIGSTCVFDCSAYQACRDVITCPAGVPREVRCHGDSSCKSAIDCSNADGCTVKVRRLPGRAMARSRAAALRRASWFRPVQGLVTLGQPPATIEPVLNIGLEAQRSTYRISASRSRRASSRTRIASTWRNVSSTRRASRCGVATCSMIVFGGSTAARRNAGNFSSSRRSVGRDDDGTAPATSVHREGAERGARREAATA
jgi:hypothetical protein